jgi:hypothetical protein
VESALGCCAMLSVAPDSGVLGGSLLQAVPRKRTSSAAACGRRVMRRLCGKNRRRCLARVAKIQPVGLAQRRLSAYSPRWFSFRGNPSVGHQSIARAVWTCLVFAAPVLAGCRESDVRTNTTDSSDRVAATVGSQAASRAIPWVAGLLVAASYLRVPWSNGRRMLTASPSQAVQPRRAAEDDEWRVC